jgi:hypothetical protein
VFPHVPLHAAAPCATQDAWQSATCDVPALVQIVIVPSPLHAARAPEHVGKHVVSTVLFEAPRSAQVALPIAAVHAAVTRSGPKLRRHSDNSSA